MRRFLILLGNDAAAADKAADTVASLMADAPTSLAATAFAATIVGGVIAIALSADIALRGAL